MPLALEVWLIDSPWDAASYSLLSLSQTVRTGLFRAGCVRRRKRQRRRRRLHEGPVRCGLHVEPKNVPNRAVERSEMAGITAGVRALNDDTSVGDRWPLRFPIGLARPQRIEGDPRRPPALLHSSARRIQCNPL